jgi:DNA-binding transcriptional LysR family regulator
LVSLICIGKSATSLIVRAVARGVTLTVAALRPALTDVQDALDQLCGLRDKPVGRVRLLASRLAAMTVLAPKPAQFTRDYPDIVLDVTADDLRMDPAAAGTVGSLCRSS